MGTTGQKTSLIALTLSLVLVIILYPRLQDPTMLQHTIAGLGWIGVLFAILLICLQTMFPVVPFALLAGINALLFGWIGGFAISLAGSILGSTIGFLLARVLGQEWARPKIAKLKHPYLTMNANSFLVVFLARLIPILPSAAVNYTAGLSPISLRIFLAATVLGKIPMIAWESWLGHDLWRFLDNPVRFALALLSGILLFGLVGLSWHLHTRKK